MAYVYIHKFPDGKFYVGITGSNPEKRWLNGCGYSTQPKISDAIDQFGWENVQHYTCKVDDIVTAERLETFLINALDSANNGYNTMKASVSKKSPVYRSLGDLVHQYRVDRGMTQIDLAKALGYTSKGMVSRIESGKVAIMVDTMSKLIEVLQISADDLNQAVNEGRRP